MFRRVMCSEVVLHGFMRKLAERTISATYEMLLRCGCYCGTEKK